MEDRLAQHRDKDGNIIMHQKWCKHILKNQQYKFAKTMPKWPHYYTLRKNWSSNELFDAVVVYIREHGQKEYWDSGRRKYPRIYYYADGYKYWTMGAPIDETILINRAKLEDCD